VNHSASQFTEVSYQFGGHLHDGKVRSRVNIH
jgi:hypothetical protein